MLSTLADQNRQTSSPGFQTLPLLPSMTSLQSVWGSCSNDNLTWPIQDLMQQPKLCWLIDFWIPLCFIQMSCPSAPQKKCQKMSNLILGSCYLSATPSSFQRPERPVPICLSCFQHRLSQTRPWSDKIRSWCCCSWASQSPGIRYKICKQLEIYKFNGFTTNLLSHAFVKVLIIDSCTSKSQRSTLPFLSPSFTFTWDVRSLSTRYPLAEMLGTSHPTVHIFPTQSPGSRVPPLHLPQTTLPR